MQRVQFWLKFLPKKETNNNYTLGLPEAKKYARFSGFSNKIMALNDHTELINIYHFKSPKNL